eukprot:186650-Chlamydomonas_euryale.AAC.4
MHTLPCVTIAPPLPRSTSKVSSCRSAILHPNHAHPRAPTLPVRPCDMHRVKGTSGPGQGRQARRCGLACMERMLHVGKQPARPSNPPNSLPLLPPRHPRALAFKETCGD